MTRPRQNLQCANGSLLERVRWFFFCWVEGYTVVTLVLLLPAVDTWWRFAVAVGGTGLLIAGWAWEQRHGRFLRVGYLIEASALLGIAVAFRPWYIVPLLFAGACYRSLHGSTRAVAGPMILYPGVYLAAQALAAGSIGGLFHSQSQTWVNTPGLILLPILMGTVASALARHDLLRRREIVLRQAATQLAHSDSVAEVHSTALEAIGLLAQTPGKVRAMVLWGDLREMELEAAVGVGLAAVRGGRLRLSVLEEHLPEPWRCVEAGEEVLLSREEGAVLAQVVDLPIGTGVHHLTPIAVRGRIAGLLWIESDREIDVISQDGLETLAAEVGLATEALLRRGALEESEARFRGLVQSSSDIVLLLDGYGIVFYASPAVEPILGASAAAIEGRHIFDLLAASVDSGDASMVVQYVEGLDRFEAEGSVEARVRHQDGSWRVLQIAGKNLYEASEVEGLVLTLRDLTEKSELEAELRFRTWHDPLTQVANRELFTQRLEAALERSRQPARPVAALVLDLDGFRAINEQHGPSTGDAVLTQIAQRIRQNLGQDDLLARNGGDEFLLLLQDADATLARRKARALLRLLAEPFAVGEEMVEVRASLGIAVACHDPLDAGELLRRAEVALYEAKLHRRGRYQLFNADLQVLGNRADALETELERALDHGELVVHFQPLASMRDGRIISFEALVRWQHPERGLLSPAAFIGTAEQSGLIVEVDRRVLLEACRQLASWRERFPAMPSASMAVNLSPATLQEPDLYRHVEAAVAATGIPPECLILEITESELLPVGDELVHQLDRIRKLGVRIALDDFGVGYSALSYLSSLPLDEVKLDWSFVRGLDGSETPKRLVAGLVDLCHSIGLEVVAEGIDSSEKWRELRRLGCDVGQGYHIARPLPPEELETDLELWWELQPELAVLR